MDVTAKRNETRTVNLVRMARSVIEHRLRQRALRARERKYLEVLRNAWTYDAATLKSMLLEVNETFRIDPTDAEIEAEIDKLG